MLEAGSSVSKENVIFIKELSEISREKDAIKQQHDALQQKLSS